MSAVLDIPYHSRNNDDDDDEAEVDSVQYVDAGTVNVVASTSRTARYWDTHQMAPHANAAFVRTTTMLSFSSVLLLAVSTQLV